MAQKFSWGMTAQLAPPIKEKPRRSLRWLDREMVRVDGIPLAYAIQEDVMVVCIPGGKMVPIGQLVERGHKIVAPKQVRAKDYA